MYGRKNRVFKRWPGFSAVLHSSVPLSAISARYILG
jgi:hypothetical protein